MPSTRLLTRSVSAVGLLAFAGVAAAQSPGAGAELSLGVRLGISFGVAFVINLLLGGVAIALGPRYTRQRIEEIDHDPASAFGWGLLVAIAVPIALALLAITIIGLVVAVPGILLLAAVGIVGNAVTIVWVGSAITGDSGRAGGNEVAVGALVLAALFAIPVIGSFLSQLLSLLGTGAVGRQLYRSWR